MIPGGTDAKTGGGPMAGPHLAAMRPFVLGDAAQFEPPPPPSLSSAQFLADLAEVRARGGALALHSPEEATIAHFHRPSGFFAWNEIARQVVVARGLDLLDSARVLAQLNFALSDAQSAGYQAKYTYNFWRPVTAIRAGGAAFHHPEIEPQHGWNPFIETPMHPEYPCLHCIAGGAARIVLENAIPNAPPFTVEGGAPQPRTYRSFAEYADEEAESRVLGGVHFRFSLVAGKELGEKVGREAIAILKPVSAK